MKTHYLAHIEPSIKKTLTCVTWNRKKYYCPEKLPPSTSEKKVHPLALPTAPSMCTPYDL